MDGVRDLLLNLLMITIGLLIALSLEGLVEWCHHVHLVEQARKSLNAELAANRRSLEKALPIVAKERAAADANLAMLQRIQDNPRDKAARHGALDAAFEVVNPRKTAWITAQATGALAYMPMSRRSDTRAAMPSRPFSKRANKSWPWTSPHSPGLFTRTT